MEERKRLRSLLNFKTKGVAKRWSVFFSSFFLRIYNIQRLFIYERGGKVRNCMKKI